MVGDGAVGKTCLCTVYTQVKKLSSGLSHYSMVYISIDYYSLYTGQEIFIRISTQLRKLISGFSQFYTDYIKTLFRPENLPNKLQSDSI